MTPRLAIAGLWTVWIASWIVAAAWSRSTVNRAGAAHQILFRVLLTVGTILLFGFLSRQFDKTHRFWPPLAGAPGWSLVAVVTLGFLFCWWARLHLGALWSSNVTRKDDHRIVDTGPYALVRHPIYTGLILATVATALAHGTPLSFLGGVLMVTGMVLKARLEEGFLRSELGPQAYDSYARRVPMLVPFWPR